MCEVLCSAVCKTQCLRPDQCVVLLGSCYRMQNQNGFVCKFWRVQNAACFSGCEERLLYSFCVALQPYSCLKPFTRSLWVVQKFTSSIHNFPAAIHFVCLKLFSSCSAVHLNHCTWLSERLIICLLAVHFAIQTDTHWCTFLCERSHLSLCLLCWDVNFVTQLEVVWESHNRMSKKTAVSIEIGALALCVDGLSDPPFQDVSFPRDNLL